MNAAPQTDPLAALLPIHTPAPPGWWPPAPGWWLLAIVAIALVMAATLYIRRRQRLRAPGRAALFNLDTLTTDLPAMQQLRELNHLLRRGARLAHGVDKAALGPQAWADFLLDTAPTDLQTTPWTEVVDTLVYATYRGVAPERTGECVAFARAWLRHNLTC